MGDISFRQSKGLNKKSIPPHDKLIEAPGASFSTALAKLPVILFTQDSELRYTYLHNLPPEMPVDKILGKTDEEISTVSYNLDLHEIKKKVLKSGTGRQVEIQAFIKDRSYHFDISIEPLMSMEGNVSGISGAAVDITRHKNTEKVLEETENYYRQIVEFSPDMIVLHNTQGIITFMNKSGIELLGASSKDEVVGKHINNFVHSDMQETTQSKIKEMKNSSKAIPPFFGQKLVRVDGEAIEVEAMGRPLAFNEEKHILAILRDVSERKEFEREMSRLEQLNTIGQVAAGLGHEIRNPLTSIRGLLQIIGEKEIRSQYKKYIDLMIGEVDQANSIITEFLALAKNRSRNQDYLNLNDILNKLSPLLQAKAAESKMELKLETGKIKDLQGEEKEIRQLIFNLACNGFEAMSPGGCLKIKTYCEGDEVVLSVQDEGKGIAPDVLKKIGTPFFTTKSSGTGLGWAIVQSIASRHNAAEEIDTGPGGTNVLIKFKLGR